MRLPLFDPAHMSDFRIGAPQPGPGESLCPGVDYSGADPSVQFPEGWHVIAGGYLLWTPEGYYVGRSWQDCSRLEPERVRVRTTDHTPWARSARCVYLLAGTPDSPGAANLMHYFTPERVVGWDSGQSLRVRCWWLPRRTAQPIPFYFNLEPRGVMTRVPQAEAYDPVTLEFTDGALGIRWWSELEPGDPIANKRHLWLPFALQRGSWHRATLQATPLPTEPGSWELRAELQCGAQSLSWRSPADAPLRHTHAFDCLYFGDEHDLARSRDGGACVLAELGAWADAPADARAD